MPIKRALIVDDSKSARFGLKKLLEKYGIEADFAASAGDALNFLAVHQTDVVFMDHLMPGMDGFEATRAIKQNRATTHLPIVMCTSKEGAEYHEQARAAGAMAILTKPAPPDQLETVLKEIEGVVPAGSSEQASKQDAVARQMATSQMPDGAVLNDVVAKLVAEMMAQKQGEIITAARQAAEQRMRDMLEPAQNELRNELLRASEARVKEIASQVSHQAAMELFDTRFKELNLHVMQQVEQRLSAFKPPVNEPQKTDNALLDEVRTVARFSAAHTAGETAREIAEQAAREIATREAESAAERAVQSALPNALGALQKQLRSQQWLGVIAIAIAIAACIAAFVI